jgi:hypothetical protein
MYLIVFFVPFVFIVYANCYSYTSKVVSPITNELQREIIFGYDVNKYDFLSAVVNVLKVLTDSDEFPSLNYFHLSEDGNKWHIDKKEVRFLTIYRQLYVNFNKFYNREELQIK